ncbi:MAG: hypothetical protein IKH88_11975 [Prevotella sp.]|nr:hypothetical protein [Prevotella sp.]
MEKLMKILRRGWMYVVVAVFVISMSGCAEEKKTNSDMAIPETEAVSPAPEMESAAPEAAESAASEAAVEGAVTDATESAATDAAEAAPVDLEEAAEAAPGPNKAPAPSYSAPHSPTRSSRADPGVRDDIPVKGSK